MPRQLIQSLRLVYGTLLFLMLLIPHSLVGWAEDINQLEARQIALPIASAIARFSDFTRLDRPYIWLRRAFLREIAPDDNR
jgi:hypothetical protein